MARTEGDPSCIAEPLDGAAALERLQPQWQALWAQAHASPFLSPAWLMPWWRHVGRGRLAAIALRCGRTGDLVGLAPWYVYGDAASGRRHLFPLGIATTDHADLLVRPGWEARAAQTLRDALVARGPDWDVLELPQLPATSPLLALAWPADWQREAIAIDPHPVLALPAQLSTGFAQRLAAARRRAARAGALAWELADARTLPAMLEALARLHAQRWALREQPGVLGATGVMDAHREAAPRLLADGLLRLLALRLDGAPIAVLYVLADPMAASHRRWSDYIGGFDPAFATFSPGLLAVGQAIELAQAEGAAAFDFLRGREPYKYRWGAVDEPRWTLRVQRA